MTLALFLLLAGAVVLAGSRVAFYGDALAEKTGLGRTWMGLVLVAATTSLPELATGTSATLEGLGDLALGDVLGSGLFNLVLLSLLDALGGRVPLLSRVQLGHALAIGFAVILYGLVGLSLWLKGPSLGPVALFAPLALLVYLLAARLTFLYERRRPQAEVDRLERLYREVPLARAVRGYALNGGVVVLAAVFLPLVAERLAQETGLGSTFVGTVFLAFTTSLPEVVVSLAAVRLGAWDLAVGNVLGSNLFNALILAWDDLLFPGTLFQAVGSTHLVAVFALLAMYGVVLVGLTYQALAKVAVLGWDTLALLGIYGAAVYLLYAFR